MLDEQQSQSEEPSRPDDDDTPSALIKADLVIRHISQLVTLAQEPILEAQGRLGIIERGALAARMGRIVWIGAESALDQAVDYRQADVLDAEGRPATPGFVDSHTHLLFAGDRAEEFHLRHQGVSYAELAAQGRGILTTVRATRAASDEELHGVGRAAA